MALFKSITIGHRVVAAGKKRSCKHDQKHTIVKGQACLEVREAMGWKVYCVACGIAMVERGAGDLDALRSELLARNITSAS